MNTQRHYSFGQYHQGKFEHILFLLRTRLVRKELGQINPLTSIIDIGCGFHATLLRKCRVLFPSLQKLAGVDLQVDPNLSQQGINAVNGDINKPLAFAGESFNAAVSTALFEHLENPEAAAKEVLRILAPGGTLITTTPSPAAKPVLEFLSLKLHLIDPTEILDHKNYFTPEMLANLFKQAGFKTVRVRKFFFGFNTLTVSTK